MSGPHRSQLRSSLTAASSASNLQLGTSVYRILTRMLRKSLHCGSITKYYGIADALFEGLGVYLDFGLHLNNVFICGAVSRY